MSTVVSNPVQDPRIAVLRTILQNAVSVLLTIVSIILIVPTIAPEILAALEPVLPSGFYLWLVGVVAFVSALAGALAKIMAIPKVNEWLAKLKLGYKQQPAYFRPIDR